MPFTPLPTAFGSLLLHLASTNHLLITGRILGISSILTNACLDFTSQDSLESYIPVISGMVTASVIAYVTGGGVFDFGYLEDVDRGLEEYDVSGLMKGAYIAGVAGFLAGVGTYFSSGCTSGHMLCGLPRLSFRSFISTLIFFPTAILTAMLFPNPVAQSATTGSVGLESSPCPGSTFSSCFTITGPWPWPWPSNPVEMKKIAIYTSLVVIASLGNVILPKILLLLASPSSSKSNPQKPQDQAKPHLDYARRLSRGIASFWSGVVFALGLIMSGMSDSRKVKGFLSIFPIHLKNTNSSKSTHSDIDSQFVYIFDPSLTIVIFFAVIPNLLRWGFWRKPAGHRGPSGVVEKGKPVLGEKWHVPTRKDVDWRLVLGSVFFGVSWGLLGICPGPGVLLATMEVVKGALETGKVMEGRGVGYVLGFLGGRGLMRVVAVSG